MCRWTCPPFLACGAVLGLTMAPLAGMPQTATSVERYHETITGTLVEFEMVRVPGGVVEVPGPDGSRAVTVNDFYIGRTEVTWDMYDVFALGLDESGETDAPDADAIARPSNPYGAPDWGFGHAGFPVMSVTRHAAEAFCTWLSGKTGRTYRLPTEAEWHLAARLATGGDTPSRARLDEIAWHRSNADRRTHAVATRAPDAVGLYDLFGNTAEWVMTESGELVTRGGSYRQGAADVGPDARAVQDFTWNDTDPQLPKSQWWLSDGPFVGFRLAAPLEGERQ